MPTSGAPKANERLRAARERTASATRIGECLSRDELAELVTAHVWHAHDKVVQVDGNYIGKLERGVICWPGALYREALRTILQVSGDGDLGFTNPRRKVVRLAIWNVSSSCVPPHSGLAPWR